MSQLPNIQMNIMRRRGRERKRERETDRQKQNKETIWLPSGKTIQSSLSRKAEEALPVSEDQSRCIRVTSECNFPWERLYHNDVSVFPVQITYLNKPAGDLTGAPACSGAMVMCLNWQNTHRVVSFPEKHFRAHKPNIPPHTFVLAVRPPERTGSFRIGHISAVNIYSLCVCR